MVLIPAEMVTITVEVSQSDGNAVTHVDHNDSLPLEMNCESS